MSFLIQCLASKQTIQEGAPCRFIPIQHNAEVINNAADLAPAYSLGNDPGPTGVWGAIGGFVPGTADDYGRMNFHDEDLPSFQNLFRSLYAHGQNSEGRLASLIAAIAPTYANQVGNRQSINIPASEWRAMWDVVQQQLEDDHLFLPDYAARLRPVSFAVVHEYAWQHLIELGRKAQRKPITIVEELAAILERDKTIFEGQDLPADKLRLLRASFVVSSLGDAFSSIAMETGFPLMRQHGSAIQRAAELSIDGAPHDQILAAFQPALDEALAMRGMNECNITIEPCRYAGQDYENLQGKRYADLVASVATRMTVDEHADRKAERQR